jgi:circadian clock protein KaiB
MKRLRDPGGVPDEAGGSQETLVLRLYLAPGAPNSERALANLRTMCSGYQANLIELEIVDVRKDPRRALEDDALITPTLLKLSPLPLVKIVGNLSQTAQVLQALGLEPQEEADVSRPAQ